MINLPEDVTLLLLAIVTLIATLRMNHCRKISLAALKAAELFIAEELEVRQCSFIPLTGPDDPDADYIASAQRALDAVRGAIAKSEGVA